MPSDDSQMFSDDDSDVCLIVPTKTQLELLNGPLTLASLNAADFLGRQPYIDRWIRVWLTSDEWQPDELPLCVSESIICDRRLRRTYNLHVRQAILRNDVGWLQQHCIVPPTKVWSVVTFETVSPIMFDYLWDIAPTPFELSSFVSHARDLNQWQLFVDHHGPDKCIVDAAQQQWYEGVEYCVNEGAALEHIVQYCFRSARLFRLVTLTNPGANEEAWQAFCLQRMLRRVEDEPLVEQWFWTHGYKSQYKHNTPLPNGNITH